MIAALPPYDDLRRVEEFARRSCSPSFNFANTCPSNCKSPIEGLFTELNSREEKSQDDDIQAALAVT
jgi:hypothetical protein